MLLSVNLPGLHLVDPAVDRFDGQVICLDFDGAQDVDYNGPVTVENIDVPAFAAPGHLAGQEQAIIAQVLDRIDDTSADTRLAFSTEKPAEALTYSTIHVGGNGGEFAQYGDIVGISERIDVGNQDHGDNAFFFSSVFSSGYPTASAFADEVAAGIAHETGHLVGYAHDQGDSIGGVLASVATTYKSPQGSSRNHYITVSPWTSPQSWSIWRASFPMSWGLGVVQRQEPMLVQTLQPESSVE